MGMGGGYLPQNSLRGIPSGGSMPSGGPTAGQGYMAQAQMADGELLQRLMSQMSQLEGQEGEGYPGGGDVQGPGVSELAMLARFLKAKGKSMADVEAALIRRRNRMLSAASEDHLVCAQLFFCASVS